MPDPLQEAQVGSLEKPKSDMFAQGLVRYALINARTPAGPSSWVVGKGSVPIWTPNAQPRKRKSVTPRLISCYKPAESQKRKSCVRQDVLR